MWSVISTLAQQMKGIISWKYHMKRSKVSGKYI